MITIMIMDSSSSIIMCFSEMDQETQMFAKFCFFLAASLLESLPPVTGLTPAENRRRNDKFLMSEDPSRNQRGSVSENVPSFTQVPN